MEIKRFSNKIIFFGVSHIKNKNKIHELIQKIGKFNPDIILIEGGFEKATFKSEKEAIKKGGEMGAISFFAKKNKILLLPNDPSPKEQLKFLIKRFGKDFSNHYFSIRSNKKHPDYFNPTLSINKFNIATRKLNKFRDDFMIKEIKLLIKKGKRICVIKGSHHLYQTKEIIESLVKKNNY